MTAGAVTVVAATATPSEAETLTVATVNNRDMIIMQDLSGARPKRTARRHEAPDRQGELNFRRRGAAPIIEC